MRAHHHFLRRLSLQPPSQQDDSEDERNHKSVSPARSERLVHTDSAAGGSAGHTRHKIVVMGAAKVGKTSLITQFLYGTFLPKYKRTVEQMHRGEFCVSGVTLTLDILDTSGFYEFPAMRALSISSSDAFILVYDVNDASTFEEVRSLRDLIHASKGTEVPIVVVGNKVDLAVRHRKVDFEITESVVTLDWENGFVEASAKDNENVSQVFKELLLQAKVKYNLTAALHRGHKQALPRHSISEGPASTSAKSTAIPTKAQLQHLNRVQQKQCGAKRNSCIIS